VAVLSARTQKKQKKGQDGNYRNTSTTEDMFSFLNTNVSEATIDRRSKVRNAHTYYPDSTRFCLFLSVSVRFCLFLSFVSNAARVPEGMETIISPRQSSGQQLET
jgi:hypothetical protein